MQHKEDEAYRTTALALYCNYFIHGIQTVILAQGMSFFAVRWQTTEAAVFGVIAAIGIGKIVVMLFSGVLSDVYGRKPIVIAGMLGYAFFFGGLLFCKNVHVAYGLALLAGGATSALDGGTYPALLEIYPKVGSRASMIVKGFIALASALVPFVISLLYYLNLSFYWIILLSFGLTLSCLCFMIPRQFPHQNMVFATTISSQRTLGKVEPRFAIEGSLCLIFAFLCLGSFYLWQQSAWKFAVDVIGMADVQARSLNSIFSISSLVGVWLSAMMMKKGFRDIQMLLYYPVSTFGILLLSCLFLEPWGLYLMSFGLGFFMAGGLLQIGAALFSYFFPLRKGLITSLYSLSFASASYVSPIFAEALLYQQKFAKLPVILLGLAALTSIIAGLLWWRYRVIFDRPKTSLRSIEKEIAN